MSKKAKQNDKCVCKTSIGGQALIEGIMMRGPKMTAMAVRDPNGEIVLEKSPTEAAKLPKICKLPLVRGVVNFVFSMKMGYKCLMRSAEIAMPDELMETEKEKEKRLKKEQKKAEKEAAKAAKTADKGDNDAAEDNNEKNDKKEKKDSETSPLMAVVMVIASILGVGLALLLFIMLPSYIYKGLIYLFPALESDSMVVNSLTKSVFEGLIKIIVLVAYMALVTLMKDIKRTFMYHGAEHKTIFCYEHGKELTVENVRGERRFHPRCGTSFLILMLLVGMFFSFFIDPLFIWITGDVPATFIRVIIKLLMLPLFMGVGYELIKVAGRHDNIVTRVISAPGTWLQHITVLEPTDDMIECAITAFKEVIPEDGSDKV